MTRFAPSPAEYEECSISLGMVRGCEGLDFILFMPIASLTLEIEIPHAQSLKDRRQVVRSMKERLRHAFNLSIAELDNAEVWNRATLGIAAISSSTSYLNGQLREIDQAAHRIANGLGAQIVDSWAEVLSPGEE
ncbi:DUF503 domain-containing protein [Edaphobacter flagellatus]|uniref:DUF503 domain-containing protein n=1 Tax=Edaphobacter flagellatus TaxID=1933044 RepID=UPI0028C4F184|nr:DUF503 domain-containing protein [Edaphobacter flagellatus]